MNKKKQIKEIELLPNWKNITHLKYAIYRKDYFEYAKNIRKPIENSYQVELSLNKEVDELEFEAFYPKGILYLLTSFQPFTAFTGKESQLSSKDGNSFRYKIHKKTQDIEIIDTQDIDSYFQLLEKKINDNEALENGFTFIKEDENKLNYISRDVSLIHQIFETKIPINFSKSWKEISNDDIPTTELSSDEIEFLSNIESEWNELNLIKTLKQGNNYVIDFIWGVNLLSIKQEDWTDFEDIKNDFLNDEFNIDKYENVTLNRKVFKYDTIDKLLNYYRYDRRTISPKMKKIETILIKRNK